MTRPLFPPVFAPIVSRPMLDDFAIRAARLRARQQPQGVPPVFPLPMRNHPLWSGNNELGQSQGFAPDANNRQTILKLDEWGEPCDWTVALGLRGDFTQLTGNNRFQVVGEIDAGVGGAIQRFEVDWLNGTSFSIPMNALNVTANYGELPDTFQAPTDLQLTVTISRNSGGRVHSPTRSFILTATSTVGDPVIQIPAFAKRVFLYPIPGPLGADQAFFYQNSDIQFLVNTLPAFLVGSFPGSQTITYMETATPVYGAPMPLPIPPFARFLRWSAPATILPKFLIAQFELNL